MKIIVRRIRRVVFSGLTAIMVMSSIQAGADELSADERIERAQLYTSCSKLAIVIYLDEDATKAELTEMAVRDAVESRLRSARLYDPKATPYLYVNVEVLGSRSAFRIDVQLKVWIQNPYLHSSPVTSLYASTWRTGGVGKGSSFFILQSLSRYIDKFLAAYLRVNEKACAS